MRLTSNQPFWAVKNGLVHSYPSLSEDVKTDVLVIGGGITGSLIAHQCIEDGFDTVLIDRREIAHGSTSATTAMLQYEIDTPLCRLIEKIGERGAVESYRACFDAIGVLQKLARRIRSSCGYQDKQSLYFVSGKKDLPWMRREFEVRSRHGFPVHWREPKEIRQQYGLLGSFGGILSDKAGSLDPFRFTHDLLEFNRHRGMAVFDKTEISRVDHGKKTIRAYTQAGPRIQARKILYCNGYESVEIIREKFVDLLATFAIAGESDKASCKGLENTLFWNTSQPYHYLRTTDDNRVIVGGADIPYQNAGKRDARLWQSAEKLRKYHARIFPKTVLKLDFAWAGTFGATRDGLPYIGSHPDFPNAYFVLGFGGNGILFSVIGMDMVSAYLRGKVHELTEYFRFGRY